MGFLDQIKRNKSGISNPAQWLIDMFNPMADSGVKVDEEKAMEHSAVYASVRIIAETIASLPLNVYAEENGEKNKAKNNYLYKLLHNKPNDIMTSFVWRETLVAHLLLWGNHYSKLELGNDGSIKSIWPLLPGKMQVKLRNGRLYYIYNAREKGQQIFDQQEILHIPGLGFNGYVGKSVIKMAREAIGLGLSAEQFGAKFFSQGAQPGGIVEYPSQLSEKAYNRYKNDMREKYQGMGNAHKLMVLEEGMKYHQTGIPPDDAQFLETRKFQIEEIARIFRVPPHMLADLDRATFSNIEQQSIDFVVNTIRPWLVRIEQSLNDKLISDRNNKNYIKFVVEGLLRGDSESRAAYYKQMFEIGAMTINEIREKEDMNPLENGDKSFVPLNYMPLDDLGQQLDENRARKKEKRSANSRRRLRQQYEGRIENAAEAVVKREVNKVRDLLNKEMKNEQTFRDKIVAYYNDKFPEEYRDRMAGVINTMADAISKEAASEIDLDNVDIDKFKKNYLETISEQHAGYSRGQLLALMNQADNIDEAIELVDERLDDWQDKKASKIAKEQAVRVENAVAREVFTYGGYKLVWETDGDPCPICEEMEGKVVGMDDNFLNTNQSIQKEGGFSASGPKAHAPLHEGCNCTISPA